MRLRAVEVRPAEIIACQSPAAGATAAPHCVSPTARFGFGEAAQMRVDHRHDNAVGNVDVTTPPMMACEWASCACHAAGEDAGAPLRRP
jgi:hypothetical protein